MMWWVRRVLTMHPMPVLRRLIKYLIMLRGPTIPPHVAADPVFNSNGKNVRSVGPRQAAPAVNAVFNYRNFWDGRASNTFNGVNPLGPLDQVSTIWRNTGTSLMQDFGLVTNSSLASQSCGPPNSQFSDEMAFAGRTMPDLGRKLLRLTATTATPAPTIIPLGAQQVSPTDSVLGPFVNPSGKGLNVYLPQLIQWAFVSAYWDGTGPTDPVTGLPTTLLTADGFQPMEANFSLFWGLAIQEYETTLSADQPLMINSWPAIIPPLPRNSYAVYLPISIPNLTSSSRTRSSIISVSAPASFAIAVRS